MADADRELFKKVFNLEDHPEGNLFTVKWKGERQVNFVKPTEHGGPRSVGSSIHTLLTAPDFISWHRHLSDEIYFWHSGGVMKVHFIDKNGEHSFQLLGDVLKGGNNNYQVVIPNGNWFAAEVVEGEHVLFSAVVMPGYEVEDWVPGKLDEMIKEFPQHSNIVHKLTK